MNGPAHFGAVRSLMLTMIRSLDFAPYLGCKWGFWRRKAKRDFLVAIRHFAIGLRGVDNWQVSASKCLSTRFRRCYRNCLLSISLLSNLIGPKRIICHRHWLVNILTRWFLKNLYIVDEFGASLPLPGEYSCFHA